MKVPKSLIEISGVPIILRLIEQFKKAGIDEIIVITGYESEVLEEALALSGVKTIFNPFYTCSDNLVSFWIGQSLISDDCIVSHSDIIIEDSLIEQLFAADGDIVLPIDKSSLNEESMKLKVVGGKVEALSKTIPLEQASGESVPLMKFSRCAVHKLKELTVDAISKGKQHLLLDAIVFELIKTRKFTVSILNFTGKKWLEIDTPEDLKIAEELFRA
ncbi:MAG: NTP transferase domain-containing protein [candidate division Zixibacteria bacterium]|nr:NTP transferase domain-containing protein [Candidatus Tariuqbacter arcticus]